MTITVHKSDFKDFPGLHEACRWFSNSIIDKGFRFFVFDGINPYDWAYTFTKDQPNNNRYAKTLEFAEENGFDAKRVKLDLDYLLMDAEKVYTRIVHLCSYPEGHIKRVY